MAYNYEWPYTDPEQYNDDWLLTKMKQLAAEWEQMKVKFTTLEEYVKNYFANLNLQDEVNKKIDAMIADGSFNTLLQTAAYPYIVSGPYKNKKMLWFMDSLGTHNYGVEVVYPETIAYATGAMAYRDAVGGTGFISGFSINNYAARIQTYESKNPETYSYVFLCMSANDSPYISSLRETIINTVLLARRIFTNAQICLVDIFFNNTSAGNIDWWGLHTAYRTVLFNNSPCQGWSCAYKTIYGGAFNSDGVHPNQGGHNFIASCFLDPSTFTAAPISAEWGWYSIRDSTVFIGINAGYNKPTITLDFLSQLQYRGVVSIRLFRSEHELLATSGWTFTLPETPSSETIYGCGQVEFDY